ncbi:hypothetical protein ACLMJK_008717 [Lecanora helva]
MKRFDLLKEQPYAVKCSAVQILNENLEAAHSFNRPMQMSSWNVLYYRFRANFDGLQSTHEPKPPVELDQSGRAAYEQGKRVINVRESENKLEIEYDDMVANVPGRTKADVVIVADGPNSYMRGLLQPDLQYQYAGYVAWRGTVPEENVTRQTRTLLENKTTLLSTANGYIAL